MLRTRILFASTAVGALLLATAAPASAGLNSLSIDPIPASPLDREAPTFDLQIEVQGDEEACLGSIEFEVEDEDTNPVTDFVVEQGVLTFGPTVPGGFYGITATCTMGQQELSDDGELAFARGIVVKDLDGSAADDATFVVQVACEGEGGGGDNLQAASLAGGGPTGGPFTLEFEYGPEGGEELFIVYSGQDCTVDETDDGGADAVDIAGGAEDDGSFSFPAPADETVTVTNTFDAPAPPPADPPAALPAEEEPDFTG